MEWMYFYETGHHSEKSLTPTESIQNRMDEFSLSDIYSEWKA